MTIAIIPARSGSKGIPHKNIRLFAGKPLLVHSIEHALQSKCIDRVVVSTDREEYANIARDAGAEVPFLRPADIAGDSSTDLEVFQHAHAWLIEHGYSPDVYVHLRPTHPIRNPMDIDSMVRLLQQHPEATSCRSISPAAFTPYKMWFQDAQVSYIKPVVRLEESDSYNLPRQALPQVFQQNACIDVVRASTVAHGSMSGANIFGFKMESCFDIDSEEEFLRAEQYFMLHNSLQPDGKSLRFVVDIDGVLATLAENNDYKLSGPQQANINLINTLYDWGHRIVLFTARGYTTGIDWKARTLEQLTSWRVKFHELHFGKPNADFYIDDKSLSLEILKSAILKL
jgi:CMP-N,N'-diacetyllegionaminic acid synthase